MGMRIKCFTAMIWTISFDTKLGKIGFELQNHALCVSFVILGVILHLPSQGSFDTAAITNTFYKMPRNSSLVPI
jgi:hypothetical protein